MSCPVCHTDRIKTTLRNSRDDFKIEINECLNCGHFYQPVENYQEIYTSGEFTQQARKGRSVPDTSKIKELDRRAYKRFQYYRDYLNKMDHILEVGSSIGSFVHLLKLNGKSATGLEPDPDYADYSKTQYGFSQTQGLLEDYLPEKPYKAICCFHVLEHVQDPQRFLKHCADLLTDDGRILFEFPSLELHMYGSMKNTIWKPHIHYFNRASLYFLFSHYFKIVRVGYFGSALFVFAEKAATSTFREEIFRAHKRKAASVRMQVRLFPEISYKVSGITVKQLVMQSLFFQDNRSDLVRRLLRLGLFSIQNKRYLNNEKGRGKTTATHFSYYSGWENAGDTVLSKTVRDNFNQIAPTRWTLEDVTNPVIAHTIDQINRRDYLVVGGGGLLLPDSNPNSISGWQWAISEQLLTKIEVPFFVYAIGYNFFKGQQPDDLFVHNLRKLVEKASFFSLRNHGSISAVKPMLDKELSQKIHFQPCPTTVIRRIDKAAPIKRKTQNVGINVAYDRYNLRYGKDVYQILDQIALALKKISAHGYRIYNLCHLENDAKFELTLDTHQVKYKTVNLQYALPRQTYETYCNMELTLGTRGHAQMIPFGLNSKIISLGSHNKLRYFLEDIDALDWYIDLRKDVPGLCDRIVTLFFEVINSESVVDRLWQQQERLYKVTKANHNIIREMMV